MSEFRVRIADWEREREAMRAIRTPVFIQEQQVPQQIEWDEMDPLCVHALALDADGTPIGTGRLAPDGKIGRMAVLEAWRGKGVGAAILEFLVASAQERGIKECHMHAQSHALDFYLQHGFETHGDEFMEAGIPHVNMRKRL
ncbi:MAG TPA: GNAT family N-acetyltransferase [Gammaproteobacteria bacterium]|jgi:predicted GNAT family N-acyltransferase